MFFDKIKVYLGTRHAHGAKVLYVYAKQGTENISLSIGEDGILVGEVVPEGIELKPFLKIPINEANIFFKAFAECLTENGFMKEIDQAKPVLEERKEQIDYLRSLTEKIIFKKE